MINEKTLELNLTWELMRLYWLRGYHTLLVGLDQLEEQRRGFDTGILAQSRVRIFQFKRGQKRRKWITFKLNDNSNHNQHKMLLATCTNRRDFGYYAFPRICDWGDMIINRGQLLRRTVFYDVIDVPIGPNDRKPHTMRLHSGDGIEVLSTPVKVNKPVMWQDILGATGDEELPPDLPSRPHPADLAEFGIRIQDFLEQIVGLDLSPAEKRQIRLLLITPVRAGQLRLLPEA